MSLQDYSTTAAVSKPTGFKSNKRLHESGGLGTLRYSTTEFEMNKSFYGMDVYS